MSERRYDEAAVARIFEEATRRALSDRPDGPRTLTAGEGLTLAQLQEIGAEVGLSPEAVAAGAAVVDAGADPLAYTGATLGMPHGVAGAVPLPRDLTDREWGIVVGRLRDTFAAHGTAESDGVARSWRNGNLQIRIEPSASGTVLRMRTHKGDGRVLPAIGGGMAGFGALCSAVLAMMGDAQGAAALGAILVPVGVVIFMIAALTVPRWARTRKAQMEEVAALVLQMTAGPATLPGPGADDGDRPAGPGSGDDRV
jgi:hypothetical protein